MDASAQAGHFTTFQARRGAVRGLDLHFARLDDATRAMFGSSLDLADLRMRIRAAIAGDAAQACTVRLVVARAQVAGAQGDADAAGTPVTRIEIEAPREPGARPLRLQSRRMLRVDPQLKHLALAPQLAARREAQAEGFDDALLVDNDGLVAEGSFWNIGLGGRDGITWPVAPALRGVTERLLQARLADVGIGQQAGPVRLDALGAFDFAFAANSRGLQEIASIDSHAFRGDPRLVAHVRVAFEGIAWQAI
ncbi:aminotransferase class IV [Luteimonas sp. MC1828]|uniref:aminotransferase class IV n=1 Tax=Luteimonas sp. MC1828 TaxID=2799787 RepID=UPI0018F26378|nr:aminotransferase class IV [Luteimonas sp. MC1828]MBJ7574567.1 aminotransferase class IV [Luteimonas sp. MC1828]